MSKKPPCQRCRIIRAFVMVLTVVLVVVLSHLDKLPDALGQSPTHLSYHVKP